MIEWQPLAAALLIASFPVSGLQSANLASPFSKGIASLRESGQVRRKQTRRALRFLSLTLATHTLPLSLLQGQKPSGKACFLWNNF